jgi:hypothetical protein
MGKPTCARDSGFAGRSRSRLRFLSPAVHHPLHPTCSLCLPSNSVSARLPALSASLRGSLVQALSSVRSFLVFHSHAGKANSIIARASSSTTPSSNTPGYVPGGPIWRDTVNDALPFPAPVKSHGSYHWAFERLLSAALVPTTAAAFVVSPTAYPTLDALLGISLVFHSHIGVRPYSGLHAKSGD